MFVSLPKVFAAMGAAGNIIGTIFFAMVLFAAITSAVSVMEQLYHVLWMHSIQAEQKAGTIEGIFALIVGIIVCLGYNKLYFEFKLPNGSTAQILDIMDYISNNLLMPIVALATCILVGWVIKPKTVIEEVEKSGCKWKKAALHCYGKGHRSNLPDPAFAADTRNHETVNIYKKEPGLGSFFRGENL